LIQSDDSFGESRKRQKLQEFEKGMILKMKKTNFLLVSVLLSSFLFLPSCALEKEAKETLTTLSTASFSMSSQRGESVCPSQTTEILLPTTTDVTPSTGDGTVGSTENLPIPTESSPNTDSIGETEGTQGTKGTEPIPLVTVEAPIQTEGKTTESQPVSVVVSTSAKIVRQGITYTGKEPLTEISLTVWDPENTAGISNERWGFSFGVAKNGRPHQITVDNQAKFDKWGVDALAWDNKTEEKVLYLTFDCGYEYKGLTATFLDILQEKEVKATFFCTLAYLQDRPDFVSRMINEGHIVGNHSANHPDFTAISKERMAKELLGVENYLRVNFGYSSSYFRYPSGVHSQLTLDTTTSLGYHSIFWSIAYDDYDTENQRTAEDALHILESRLHPGAVILLHAVSTTNAVILGDFIDYAREQGYEFRSLDSYYASLGL
jgi:peptidoglycan-N-acetylmuramic acid deacetylase